METTTSVEDIDDLFARTIGTSAAYVGPALLLAFVSASCLGLATLYPSPIGLVRPPWTLGPELVVAGTLAAHVMFVSFLTGLMASSERSLAGQIGAAGRAVLRGVLPMAVFSGGLLGLLFLYPPGASPLWAATTLLAAPERFNRHGWAGWARLFDPAPLPVLKRLAVMTPSFLLLSAMTCLFSNAGDSWGFMDGGVFLFPLLSATAFWGSFSCALFSAHFAGELWADCKAS